MSSGFKRLLGSCLAAGLLGATGAAQAAFVQGNWDPAYGAPFSQLGWEGNARIFVPDECLANDGQVQNDYIECGPGMSVVDAQVRFYNLSTSNIVEQLDFTGSVQVGSIFVDDGKVVAFSLFGLSRVASTSAEARPDGSPDNAYFLLDLEYTLDLLNAPLTPGPVVASLLWFEDGGIEELGGVNSTPAIVTVTQVPVPGTLTLALASLALLGGLRRR